MEKKSELDGTGIVSETLVDSSTAWDGSKLPPYPTSAPRLTIMRYVFPPHTITNEHYHTVINCGVVLKGTLTIVNKNGTIHEFHAGEALVETDGEIHHGENRGDIPVELIMFYANDAETPLSYPAEQ